MRYTADWASCTARTCSRPRASALGSCAEEAGAQAASEASAPPAVAWHLKLSCQRALSKAWHGMLSANLLPWGLQQA